MMSKNDGEIRFGNPTELHGTKVQIPYLTAEKLSFKRMDEEEKQQETQSPTMSPLASPPSSPPHYQRVPLSHGYSKLRSSTEQMHPAPYEARQSLVQPEGSSSGAKPVRHQASLIRSFSVERELQDNSNYPDEPWRITEEQREYYVNQFRSLQPDPSSFISGSVAKNFFTKSKLSIPELSYIWELSDADCDGALTLPEFCAAFHLIVARKNGYPLPEGLPPTLQPEYLQAAFPKSKWECALFDSYSESVPANQQPRDLNRMEKMSVKDVADFPGSAQDTTGDDKQALKSAINEALPKDLSEDPATSKDSNSLKGRPRSRSYSSTSIEEAMKRGEDPPTPPPRPQKTHSRASSLDLNKVFQPTEPATKSGLLPPPPALPPRPCPSQISQHNVNTEHSTQPKPPSQLPNYGDVRRQEQSEQVSDAELLTQMNRTPSQAAEGSPAKKDVPYSQPPSKPIRRKFRPENQSTESQEPSTAVGGPAPVTTMKPHPTVQKQSSKQKKAIQTAIRKNKEANAVLARLNSELQQQLKEVHQERIALENQLEQLRPVTVL
ncbi:ralBP1-associated Eps domain-containing protein 2 isoform X11 [Perognathus longimembris pacificus]|nr:ralBP1-associated Eps domain-containing protein 2 isoform X11 [Perognathus longimembris pacificus]XP_048192862.1 ralBP1-associated Eps domain-containing protein 2 isoform X11 [Perognathus longimembris pacificus]